MTTVVDQSIMIRVDHNRKLALSNVNFRQVLVGGLERFVVFLITTT